jgi:hypothetical protein
MKLLHGIKLRENVQLVGIPIVWRTNLSDEDVRNFYMELKTDPDFEAFIGRKDGVQPKGGGLTISFSIFSKAINFKDGCCQCFGVYGNLWLIYRTTKEWELLEAREKEIQELRDEQEQERQAEQLICQNEDNYLSAKVAESLNEKNYPEATRFLRLRVELRKQNPKIKVHLVSKGGLLGEVIKTFCYFPKTDEGIRFLLDFLPRSWVLFGFAKNYWSSSSHSRQDVMSEVDKIFRAVIEHFPTDARIHKMICLFLEREGELKRAIEYCEKCTSRPLSDGTVSGFAGRLKRLQSKRARLRVEVGGA